MKIILSLFLVLCSTSAFAKFNCEAQYVRSSISDLESVKDDVLDLSSYVANRRLWNNTAQIGLLKLMRNLVTSERDLILSGCFSRNELAQLNNKFGLVQIQLSDLNRYLQDRDEWDGSANERMQEINENITYIVNGTRQLSLSKKIR